MAKKPKNESVIPKKRSNLVYQMKITLKDVKPPIWRRIQVKGDVTLNAFHRTIQMVMGWGGGHLHEFDIRGILYGDPEDGPFEDEKKFRLKKLNLEEKEKFFYVYDFGDNWQHQILVEKILPIDEKTQYPICLAGKRSGPPEDCGGSWGYMDLLDVLKDPDHPEYEESKEWVGDLFDSEKFDIEKINRWLKPMRGGYRIN
jgi:hypothetical protein